MRIDLPDDFARGLRKFMRENNSRCFTIEAFIENVTGDFMESWPWGTGDICVHCDKCMHRKTVAEWKEEQK
jgi:hypothetical protein